LLLVTAATCANAASLTFSGNQDDVVGNKGPFSFAGWKYYFPNSSVPEGYPQAIYNIPSQPGPNLRQVITVTAPAGILLCGIAGSGYAQATTTTIQGTTLSATPVTPVEVAFPAWTAYANATFDATWQPLQSISIITNGDQIGLSVVIWEISYVVLAT
jgi:hypothetical protein